MANVLQLRFPSILSMSTQEIDVESTGSDGITIQNITVPAPSTDLHVSLNFVRSLGLMLLMVCDRACTVETNDGSTPDDTISLLAGVPFLWYPGCGFALAADLTDLYVTLGSGAAATLKIRAVQDILP